MAEGGEEEEEGDEGALPVASGRRGGGGGGWLLLRNDAEDVEDLAEGGVVQGGHQVGGREAVEVLAEA